MKPVRLPAAATRALPRIGLLALCLLYILPGLIGRDPWKIEGDVSSFGVMWTMAHGSLQDWLLPHIANLPVPQEGPLTYWIGAICIRLASWLVDDDNAARLTNVLFFALGASSIWHATYALGRRSEAQPLKLAFGGQPEPEDFGRTLADGAVLIYMGSLGLLVHSHFTSPTSLLVALIAFALYAAIRLFDVSISRPIPEKKYALLLGLALGLLVLTRGWLPPLALWITCIILAFYRSKPILTRLIFIVLPVALAITACWLLSCLLVQPFNSSPYTAWLLWNKHEFFRPSYNSLHYFIKYSVWFTWPAWPFAGWAVYAWRKQTTALHIALPLSFLAALTTLALCSPHAEQSSLIPLLPPLAILAAFGLPTMKRSAINAVDWFSLTAFSIFALFIWLSWIGLQTGWPEQLHRNALKSMPGFTAQFSLPVFLIALTATIGWLKLVHWRISRHPSVLWRAVVLSSSGVIMCWLLIMTLWMPWINYRVSYQQLAQDIAKQLPENYRCVDTNIGKAQRASFAYFGHIRFSGLKNTGCDYSLIQRRKPKTSRYQGSTPPIWEGSRLSDQDERFVLLKK